MDGPLGQGDLFFFGGRELENPNKNSVFA